MKVDVKTILILALLGAAIVFFALWFFRGSGDKDRINELQLENKKIELVRDSLKNVNNILKIDFDKKQKDIDDRDNIIKKTEAELSKTKQDLSKAAAKVAEDQKQLEETKKKISDLEKNPIKREGDDLINSLKEKLK